MTKQEFIRKWNVAFESKEQELEFASEMEEDLDSLEEIRQLKAVNKKQKAELEKYKDYYDIKILKRG